MIGDCLYLSLVSFPQCRTQSRSWYVRDSLWDAGGPGALLGSTYRGKESRMEREKQGRMKFYVMSSSCSPSDF